MMFEHRETAAMVPDSMMTSEPATTFDGNCRTYQSRSLSLMIDICKQCVMGDVALVLKWK
jgi:hypothetical protein